MTTAAKGGTYTISQLTTTFGISKSAPFALWIGIDSTSASFPEASDVTYNLPCARGNLCTFDDSVGQVGHNRVADVTCYEQEGWIFLRSPFEEDGVPHDVPRVAKTSLDKRVAITTGSAEPEEKCFWSRTMP